MIALAIYYLYLYLFGFDYNLTYYRDNWTTYLDDVYCFNLSFYPFRESKN